MYITDDLYSRVRKVTISTGIITTIAGSATFGYDGDGFAATSAFMNGPTGVVVDSAGRLFDIIFIRLYVLHCIFCFLTGNVYIADQSNNRVRIVTTSTGIISTFAGTGSTSSSVGDGGEATSATLNNPYGVALDSSGLYFILPSHRDTHLLHTCSHRQFVHH